MMHRSRPQPIRNMLDLADTRQVRSLKKRLRLSEDQLNEIVGRIGNSIAAISKEVAMQKARRLRPSTLLPEAEIIAAATVPAAGAAAPSTVEQKAEAEGTSPPSV
jgi:hypothetical protein